jgi:hypothetical protein
MNPVGFFVPPATVFPRKNEAGALERCYLRYGLISDSGFINSELFIEWPKRFAEYAKPKENDSVLLIVDSHTLHCRL